MNPTVGRIVIYRLNELDADAINRRRDDARGIGLDGKTIADEHTGAVVHTGNSVQAGDEFPAVIVRVFDPARAATNLQVLLDGNDTYWATSRIEGNYDSAWHWPERTDT